MKEYLNIWNKLRATYDIKVPRDKVMEILGNIDPINSALRKARKLSTVKNKSSSTNWQAFRTKWQFY